MTRSSRSKAAAAAVASTENNDETDQTSGGRRSTRARHQTVFFTETDGQPDSPDTGINDSNDDVSNNNDGDVSDDDDASDDNEVEVVLQVLRKSSRSTAFRGEMKDPSNSIADLLKDGTTSNADEAPPKKRRGARQSKRSSLEGDDDDIYQSPKKKQTRKKGNVKSPAKRHSKRRKSKRLEYPPSESSEEEPSSSSDEDDEEERSSEEEEEEEMKINKIVACKSLPLADWVAMGKKMNTTEIKNGSRWIQENDVAADLQKYEERFLIKWNDLSFLHCSWETEKDLVEFCEGAKGRLSTFFRKAEGGLLYEADERLDGDYFDPNWITIERILEVTDNDSNAEEEPAEIILDVKDPNFEDGTGRQFYIKWVNKSYSESTFEFERDLILNEVEFQQYLDLYDGRKVKPTKKNMQKRDKEGDKAGRKLYKMFGDKIKSDDVKEELVKEYQETLEKRVFKCGGQLRDYQAEGVSWLMSNHLNKRSSILADEMGLGKTIQTATYINTVSEQLHTRGPFLIVAPLSTIPHWYREFTGWTNLNTIVYHGSANDRERVREDEFPFPADKEQNVAFNQRYLQKVAKKWRAKWEKTWMVEVVITTPEMLVCEDFAELAAVRWEIMVVDEAHRLKNHNSKLAQNLRNDKFEFNQTLLLTGTPIQNNMQEMWTLLNFINPSAFESVEEFMEQYGDIKSKEKVDQLHETIRPYILRRLKEDVEKSVPPKEETLIEVELTVLQKQYYRALYEKNLKFLHRNKKSAMDGPSINNLAMQLRKCCNHPYLLTGVESEVRLQNPNTDDLTSMVNASGKFVLLDKLLPRLKKDGHRVLLFSQFKIMLDIIEDYLNLRDFKGERIDGSITGLKRQAAIDRFQSKDSGGREQPFIMLLSTRAGGVGINLTAADTCIIFDSDWNPQNDLQAQARCHRIGQTKNVKIYRLLTRKTYEMQMFHMSSMKMGLDQAVLQGIENSDDKDTMTKEQVEKLLKHGAYDIFKEDQDGTSEKESTDFVSQDIDSILDRAKRVVHENTGSNSNAAGGTFSKASFKATNSDGIAAAEVDVDDPDFWTKVVGETKEEEEEQLGKRKRMQQNYSEKAYLKRLDAAIRDGAGSDADGNGSAASEYSDSGEESDDEDLILDNESLRTIVQACKSKKQDERFLWGGAARSEWKQYDAELVMKALTSFGYGNISWPKLYASLPLSKPMKLDEVKRMCWSMLLMCLYEAAEDDALEVARKAKATSKEIQAEGGVLASTGNIGVIDTEKDPSKSEGKQEEKEKEKKDQLEESFKILLSANESWVEKVLADALGSSKTITSPRDRKYVQSIIDGNHPSSMNSEKKNLVHSKLDSGYYENVWPALRSRGWKRDESNKTDVFTYSGKTFKSITAVLDAIPKYHPELMNMANSLIAAVAASCEKPSDLAPVATLDLKNVTSKALKLFLMDSAPLQLLADRKRANRVGLTKRILTKLVLLNGVHKIVSTADSSASPEASLEERNLHLSKLININPRSTIPHPEWTLLHDAILTRAVTKHGWIDTQSTCLSIGNDKTISWGSPFEISDEVAGKAEEKEADPEAEKKFQLEYIELSKTSSRAVEFLRSLKVVDGLPAPVLNEIRQRLIKLYGLVHHESDDEWKVDEEILKKILRPAVEKARDDCEALPSRKKMVKRMRKLALSFTGKGGSPDEEKEESPLDNLTKDKPVEPQNYGFHVIDQSDQHNILLTEMVKGQLMLKATTKVSTVKYYTCLILGEISARIEDLAKSDENNTLIQELEKTGKHIQLYLNTFKKGARAAKNILRVMLGTDPVPAKIPTEPLFAMEEAKSLSSSGAAKAALTKLKKKKAFTPADSALNRALGSYLDEKDGIKDCLLLTSTEILSLTVLASQGLPVFLDDWRSLLSSDGLVLLNDLDEEEEEFKIYFSAMGGIMGAAAEVWLGIARKKLETELLLNQDKQTVPEKDKNKIALLKKDYDAKEMTLLEAKGYSDDPLLFAKKCIVLLEAVRKNMGPVDLQYAGEKKIRLLNKSENGLGTKVLNWFSKDLQKWAGPLGVIDKTGKVLSTTSISSTKNHPQSRDAAMMTKRDCRTVFIQIAQQTRLRSIFTKHSITRLSTELIPKVMKQSSFALTEWEDIPPWWNADREEECNHNCQDDIDLLVGILDYGYGGFDSLLVHDYLFCKRLGAEGNENSKTFTRSTVQVRINHLTRELHGIDDTEEMMKLVQKKRKGESEKQGSSSQVKKTKPGGGIQSGLQAFFKRSSPSPSSSSKRQKTPPISPENSSDIEVIEIDSDSGDTNRKKRKLVECAEADNSPKKH